MILPSETKAVLFDLDGTLVDSAPDIHAAMNIVLAQDRLGPLTLDQVKSMIGHGVRKLVERAYAACGRPLAGDALDEPFLRMMDVYGSNLTKLTVLMPGVADALDACDAAGLRMGVVTNKPQGPTEIILRHFGLHERFGVVVGGDAGYEKKPAPDMLLAALSRLGTAPGAAMMIGDSGADVQSARNAQIGVVVVEGGYTTVPVTELGADRVIRSLSDLPGILNAAVAD